MLTLRDAASPTLICCAGKSNLLLQLDRVSNPHSGRYLLHAAGKRLRRSSGRCCSSPNVGLVACRCVCAALAVLSAVHRRVTCCALLSHCLLYSSGVRGRYRALPHGRVRLQERQSVEALRIDARAALPTAVESPNLCRSLSVVSAVGLFRR